MRCPVCASDLQPATAAHCRGCDAPHHAECWSYNGGCARYACRGRKLTRSGPAGLDDLRATASSLIFTFALALASTLGGDGLRWILGSP